MIEGGESLKLVAAVEILKKSSLDYCFHEIF